MLPNVHGITGTACTLSVYAITKDIATSVIVGGIIAFLSHDVMDRLGEMKYKNFIYNEAVLFAIFCFIAWQSELTLLYAVGWIGGNTMDLIDKKMGLSVYDNKKYPFGTFFPCHRRTPNYFLTIKQTKAIGIITTLILILTIWSFYTK